MGRKTYDSLPKLKDREYLVISRSPVGGVNCVTELPDIEGFLIGGASLLTLDNLKKCKTIYHTTVDSEYCADVYIDPDVLTWLATLPTKILLKTNNITIREHTNEEL